MSDSKRIRLFDFYTYLRDLGPTRELGDEEYIRYIIDILGFYIDLKKYGVQSPYELATKIRSLGFTMEAALHIVEGMRLTGLWLSDLRTTSGDRIKYSLVHMPGLGSKTVDKFISKIDQLFELIENPPPIRRP